MGEGPPVSTGGGAGFIAMPDDDGRRLIDLVARLTSDGAPQLSDPRSRAIGDSRCEGVVAFAIWTGGYIAAGDFAMSVFATPGMNLAALAPYFAATADRFEAVPAPGEEGGPS